MTIALGEREGDYDGKADARPYRLEAHTGLRAQRRRARRTSLEQVADAAALDAAPRLVLRRPTAPAAS